MSVTSLGKITPNWPQIQLMATMVIPLIAASCVPEASASRLVPAASVRDLPTSQVYSDSEPTDATTRERVSRRVAELLAPTSSEAAMPFSDASQSGEDRQRSLNCLTAAVYYEARSESEDGQRAVAQVVLNRVRHPAFPSTVCGVVFQGSQRRTGCQFSFTCDGSMRYRRDTFSWIHARRIAEEALSGTVFAAVGNATHYHTTAIMPYWAHYLSKSAIVGAHIFYRWAGNAGEASAFRQRYGGLEPAPALWNQPSTPEVAVHRGNEPRVWKEDVAVDDGAARVTIHRGGAALSAIRQFAQDESATEVGDHGVRIHSGTAPTS